MVFSSSFFVLFLLLLDGERTDSLTFRDDALDDLSRCGSGKS